jgi:hypothetical protein
MLPPQTSIRSVSREKVEFFPKIKTKKVKMEKRNTAKRPQAAKPKKQSRKKEKNSRMSDISSSSNVSTKLVMQ